MLSTLVSLILITFSKSAITITIANKGSLTLGVYVLENPIPTFRRIRVRVWGCRFLINLSFVYGNEVNQAFKHVSSA